MLCGNAISGVTVSISYVLQQLECVVPLLFFPQLCRPHWCCSENRDKTETLLAFGASRYEACRPLAVNGLRLALMPTINQMRYVVNIPLP
jgi:Uncharacterised protein family (UPF0014)